MEVSAQLHAPAALLPDKERPVLINGGWAGHRVALDVSVKRKI